MSNISKWSASWQLSISNEKSKWLLISNKRNLPDEIHFELSGATLPRVHEVLDLGVNLTSRLNFEAHITIIIAKAKQRLFLLKKALYPETQKY